ncbi:MAG TPA: nuclear transport factor 2 family protein [Solirubrobacteraceae bacterium]|nr:nuclear transport factor 2 family protein [Solirubrobacteraceae bacterium]
MKARTLTWLCAPLLALGLGACGAAVSTGGFKGEQHAVAQAISNLQKHVTALEQKKVCSDDLASAVVARLNVAPGGCAKAIETQMKEIDSFEVTVESVQIGGATATARVKSVHEGKSRVDTLKLVKEGGKWKISG